jgi:hypothetical protein
VLWTRWICSLRVNHSLIYGIRSLTPKRDDRPPQQQ